MRIVWYTTGAVVLVCATLLAVRGYLDRVSADRVRTEAATLADADLHSMFSLLVTDPQARRSSTRRAVEAVARRAINEPEAAPAEAFYALGLLRHGQANTPAAERAYRKAIEMRPDWCWPYNALGIELFELNQVTDAEEMFHRASALDPNWSRPHNDLAVLLRLAGRLDEAEREALIALQLDPNDVATHNNYGNLLAAQTKLSDAEREYRKAIELDPQHPSPYYNLACISSRMGRAEEAITQLRKALSLEPGFVDEARHDPDFGPLANNPEFQALVAGGA